MSLCAGLAGGLGAGGGGMAALEAVTSAAVIRL